MSSAPTGPTETDLEVVLFRVGGVRFGADASQVISARSLRDAALDEPLRWFHQSMDFPEVSMTYRNPVALTLREGDVKVVVDDLEEIIHVPLADLHPFPGVIESAVRSRGLWAVARQGLDLVLLVDLHRLASIPVIRS